MFTITPENETERKFGQLVLYADNFTTSGNILTASGDVNINNLMYFNSDLTVDLNTLQASGSGRVFIKLVRY